MSASCTCGFRLDSQQATFCFLCHSPQHPAHCVHSWLASPTRRPAKAGSSHLETPQNTSQKTNRTEMAAPHWLRRSHHLLGSHTPSEGSSGPAEHRPTSAPREWAEVMAPRPSLPASQAHLIEDTLHLLHRFALVFTGQKSMLWKERESVNNTGTRVLGPLCLGDNPGAATGQTHLGRLLSTAPVRTSLPRPSPPDREETQPREITCVSLGAAPSCFQGCVKHPGLAVSSPGTSQCRPEPEPVLLSFPAFVLSLSISPSHEDHF